MRRTGPVGESAPGDDGLMALLARAGAQAPDGRRSTVRVVCRFCEWDLFEVSAGECFCLGCCLPLGVRDGDVYSPVVTWELVNRGGSSQDSCGGALILTSMDMCPAGHGEFEVAASYTMDTEGRVCRVSIGLRCPVDGALWLFVDDARVVLRAAPEGARADAGDAIPSPRADSDADQRHDH